MLPKIAIVGRPNVGKSTLFNRICKKRIAIVDEAEGITRDRIYAKSELFGRPFELIDTGGLNPQNSSKFQESIERQAEIAILEADSIIMVVDATVGLTELDVLVAKILHRSKKPICIAINKIDSPKHEELIHNFYPLNIDKIMGISAVHGTNIAELLQLAIDPIPEEEIFEQEDDSIKVGIIGRPNVGKSTLINNLIRLSHKFSQNVDGTVHQPLPSKSQSLISNNVSGTCENKSRQTLRQPFASFCEKTGLLGEDRCVTDPVAGTTRDYIDIKLELEGQKYTFTDTAGIRKKNAEKETVDKFAACRTHDAIERSDLCLLMLDSRSGMTFQDKKIADKIKEAGKGCIILFNKWDLVKDCRMEHCRQDVHEQAPFTTHCPFLFISAKEGRNLDKIFPTINTVYEQTTRRIATHQLNTFIEKTMQKNHPPMIMGKRLRIYYMTQIRVAPPRFILFVNYADRMTENYKKYLLNQFRKTYGFQGAPLCLHLRNKKR